MAAYLKHMPTFSSGAGLSGSFYLVFNMILNESPRRSGLLDYGITVVLCVLFRRFLRHLPPEVISLLFLGSPWPEYHDLLLQKRVWSL